MSVQRNGTQAVHPTAAPDRGSTKQDPSDRWLLVVTAGLAIFMAQLDTTIVNVALPTIEADLGVTTTLAQWVVLAYMVPLIGFGLLAGRWLDAVDHRPALVLSVGGFALASIAAGLAPGMSTLLAARAAQGLVAAVVLALGPVLAVTAVGPHAHGRAFGVVGVLAPLGAMSGPVVGGYVVDTFGWPWIFLVNVPVALAIIAMGMSQLPRGTRLARPARSWFVEALLISAAAVAILLASTFVGERRYGWALLALVALPLLAVWSRLELSRSVRQLVATPGLGTIHVVFVAAYTVLLLVQFLATYFLVNVRGVTATVTGLTMLAFPAMTAALGLISGILADRFGSRRMALLGAAVISAGVATLLPISATWTTVDLAWRLAVTGAGFGLLFAPAATIAMGLAPAHLLATTAASTNLARYLGLSLGPALATAVWAASSYQLVGMRGALALGFSVSLIVCVAMARGCSRSGSSHGHASR